MRQGVITRAEAWHYCQNVMVVMGITANEIRTFERAAKLLGKSPFDIVNHFYHSASSFRAFCSAAALGADDATLRAMLKIPGKPAERT